MSNRRHRPRRPRGAKRTRRRGPAPDPPKPKRWRGPLIGGLAAVPVGLGLAAALVLVSAPDTEGSSPSGADAGAGSALPDDSAFPDDDFFAAPDDSSADPPPPDAEERGAPATGSDSLVPPSSAPSEDSGDSGGGSGASEGSGGSGGSAASAAEAVVDLVNEERADAGCDPVRVDADLTAAAEKHSADMADRDYMAHESPEGTTPAERAAGEGYDALTGENVAAGQNSPEAVMESWMNSEGHRANILDCDNKAIGVGEDDSRWTQKFGSE